jgi:hypothetical protein
MMRNTPPADEFPPQQPPVTTRGDLAVEFLTVNFSVWKKTEILDCFGQKNAETVQNFRI